MTEWIDFLKQTFDEWNSDNVPRLAASLAFYTALSLAPLLVLVVSTVGFFFGEQAVEGEIVSQLSSELGSESAVFVQQLIANASAPSQGLISTAVSLVIVLVGATTVFAQLQSMLNDVWGIEVETGVWVIIRKRLLSFGMVLVLGFLLLVSLVLDSVIAALDTFLVGILPNVQLLIHGVTTLMSFAIATLLFAFIYQVMPDADVHWQDVFVGAIVTALLFNIGRFALSLYLGNVGITSSYGAAGSFMVILLWVYYSAQIMMFGAEFTKIYARRYGQHRIQPIEAADFVRSKQMA